MAELRPITIDDFTGGLNTADATIIADNEVSDAENYYYTQDKILSTRKGTATFAEPVPDSVTLIHNMDAFNTNGTWAIGLDATNIATDTTTLKRGAGSVSFDITVATSGSDAARIQNTSLSAVDLTSVKETGTFRFWAYIPSITNFTSIQLQLGNSLDVTDYLGTATTQADGDAFIAGWNRIKLTWSAMTITGAPTGSIAGVRVIFNYSSSYTNQTGARVDDIMWYSGASTLQVHTLRSHTTTTGTKYLLAGCGANIFQYDADNLLWEAIKTGLTSGTKFDSVIFRNIIYITNGTDTYFDYNGTTTADYAGAPRGKYIIVANDVGYISGVSTATSTVYYSGSNPANLQAFANTEVINEDDGQVVTGLNSIGPLVVVGKTNSTFILNVATTPVTIENVDYDGGISAHRSIVRVENDVYFMTQDGVFSLSQRQGTTGSLRALPLSRKIQGVMDKVVNKDISAGIYWPKSNNLYLAVDTENTGLSNTILVLSKNADGAWTYYTGINANQFAIYTDATEVERLLVANCYGGQVIEMETTYADQGSPISTVLKTKSYINLSNILTFARVDYAGFHSEGSSAKAAATITNVVKTTSAKYITYTPATDSSDPDSLSSSLGSSSLGSTPLGGASGLGGGEVTPYAYVRYAPLYLTGKSISVTFTTNQADKFFALNKMAIRSIGQPYNFIPTSLMI